MARAAARDLAARRHPSARKASMLVAILRCVSKNALGEPVVIAKILAVPISYFFADLQSDGAELRVEDKTWREQLQRPETIELIRFYYAIVNPEIRRHFLEMAKSVAEGGVLSRRRDR